MKTQQTKTPTDFARGTKVRNIYTGRVSTVSKSYWQHYDGGNSSDYTVEFTEGGWNKSTNLVIDAPAQAQHSPFPNLEARNTPELVPELPWFVSHDEAQDCAPHTNSGLAKIDTGRESDWPVARLLEWPTAHFIVRACNNAQRLADALNKTTARLDYAHLKGVFNMKDAAAIEQAREALAEWEKAQ